MLFAFFFSTPCVYLFDVLCKFFLRSSTNYLRKCTQLLITSSNNRQTFLFLSFLRGQKGKFFLPPIHIYFNLKAQIGSSVLWAKTLGWHKKIHLNKSIFALRKHKIVGIRIWFSSGATSLHSQFQFVQRGAHKKELFRSHFWPRIISGFFFILFNFNIPHRSRFLCNTVSPAFV